MDLSELDPKDLRIALDREMIRRGGLAEFCKRAFQHIEPSTHLLWNWHLDAGCELLEAVSRGEVRNALLLWPPGCMKSLLVSTLWPAWDWIENSGRRFITATYAQELTNKNAKLHRDLVLSDWYTERWGEIATITGASSKQIKNFENTAGGSRVSTATGAGITGRHGHILVFDDLIKAQDAEGKSALDPKAIYQANEFWFKVMATRQANPATTAKVGIMQRLHYEDTAALCIDSGDYEVLCLPMRYDPDHQQVWKRDPRKEGELLWPERFGEDEVGALEHSLGRTAAAAQLQQEPAPAAGAMFQKQDLGLRWPNVPSGSRMIISVDCSFKAAEGSDRVAIQVWAKAWTPQGHRYYLVDQVCERLGIVDTVAAIERLSNRHPKVTAIHVEEKANGSAVIELLKKSVSGVRPWPPKGQKFPSKVEKANAVLPLFEAGEVLLPERGTAPWVDDFIQEMTRFPVGKHDDQVDACTMALLILRTTSSDLYSKAFGKKDQKKG